MDRFEHLKHRGKSWKETLESMCACYGTFCGRWHSNEFWRNTRTKILEMTEEQCRGKIIEIEKEADANLAYWQACQ